MPEHSQANAAGRIVRAPIPRTRDPFINTNLISVGPGDDGEERFWISTYNNSAGCIGALISESGTARLHRFDQCRHRNGFYSAVAEDAHTLWLCGDLSLVMRLDLQTGKTEEFSTGAPSALVFQGMILDPQTGKLFAVAFPPPHTTAFSFDYRSRKPVKLHSDICLDHFMRHSFPNGDGTYSCVLHCPGETLLRWDPLKETLATQQFNPQLDMKDFSGGTTYRLIGDERGRQYFPRLGWFDPKSRTFTADGPRPNREMTWFARRGTRVWGTVVEHGNAQIGVWEMAGGEVRSLCSVPDSHVAGINLTASGKLVAVNLYGEFFRFDGETGALEISRRLPTDSIGHVDCLCRIDKDRLLGTPFITQRFWEVNLKTKKGRDCGRAAPGFGEILRTWKIGKRIYMAAYGGGELMEYDPDLDARFPENPRVVADPPMGMRPVAAADDGRNIFYSCSIDYGNLGCVLTKHDTQTGLTFYKRDPLGDQQVLGMFHDAAANQLICGTTMHADCQSCPPRSAVCYLARISAQDFSVIEQVALPQGIQSAGVAGPMGGGRWLCTGTGAFPGEPRATRWFVMDGDGIVVPPPESMQKIPADGYHLTGTGKPGLAIVWTGNRFELWDLRKPAFVKLLQEAPGPFNCFVQDDSVYLASPREIIVLENCLKG